MKKALPIIGLLLIAIFSIPQVDASARRHEFIKSKKVRTSASGMTAYRGIASYSRPARKGLEKLGLQYNSEVFYRLTPSEQLEYLGILVKLSYYVARDNKHFSRNENFHQWLEKLLIEKAYAGGFNRGIFWPDATDNSFATDSLFTTKSMVNHCPAGEGPCAFYFGLVNGKAICAAGNHTPNCLSKSSEQTRKQLRDAIMLCKNGNPRPAVCDTFRADLANHTKGLQQYCTDPNFKSKYWCKDAAQAFANIKKEHPDILVADNKQPDKPKEPKEPQPEEPKEPLKEKAQIDLNSCYPAGYDLMSRARQKATELEGDKLIDHFTDLAVGMSKAEKDELKKKSTPEKIGRLLPHYKAEREKVAGKMPPGGNCKNIDVLFDDDIDKKVGASQWCMFDGRVKALEHAEKRYGTKKPAVDERWKQLIQLAAQGCPEPFSHRMMGQYLNHFGACDSPKKDPKALFDEANAPKPPDKSDYFNQFGDWKFKDSEANYKKHVEAYKANLALWEKLKQIKGSGSKSDYDNWTPGNLSKLQVRAMRRWRDNKGKLPDADDQRDFREATGMTPEAFKNVFCESGSSDEFYRKVKAHVPANVEGATATEVLAGTYIKNCVDDAFKDGTDGKKNTGYNQNNCGISEPKPNEVLDALKSGTALIHSTAPGMQKCLTVDKADAVTLGKGKLSVTEWPLDQAGKGKQSQLDLDTTNLAAFTAKYKIYQYKCASYDTGFDVPGDDRPFSTQ